MKILLIFGVLVSVSYALINDIDEDCIVINPIGNTILTAGEKMKIQWSNSHAEKFENIYLVQSDGNQEPIIIASDVYTTPNKMIVDLPWNLTPSNAYYMILGDAPYHCTSGNLRILAATSVPPPPTSKPFEKGGRLTPGSYPKEEANTNTSSVIRGSVYMTGILGIALIIIQSFFVGN